MALNGPSSADVPLRSYSLTVTSCICVWHSSIKVVHVAP